MKSKLFFRIAAVFMVLAMLLPSVPAFAIQPISEYVEIDGKKYKPKQNVITYLLMGIDQEGKIDRSVVKETQGRCDVIVLLVIDKAADTFAYINLNRDTITDVHTLSEDGEDLAVTKLQLSLAHENGDGYEMSCKNVATAVSDLLLGITIDHYAAINMDGIRVLNASVGGVDVLIEDDFSAVDPAMVPGKTVHLTDDQAYLFIRSRTSIGDGTNVSRIRRQKQYLENIKPLLLAKYEADMSFPLDLAHALEEYMVTDMTDKDYSYIAKAALKNRDLGTFELEGTETVDRHGWIAFIPDETSITKLVMELFYNEY